MAFNEAAVALFAVGGTFQKRTSLMNSVPKHYTMRRCWALPRRFSLSSRLAACAALFWPIVACCAQAADGPPSLDEIIAGVHRTEQLLFQNKSLLLRYERIESHDVTPNSYSGGFETVEWALAYRGDKWYLEQRFTHPRREKGHWVPGEPQVHVAKSGAHLLWDQSAKNAYIRDNMLGGGFYAGAIYVRNLSLDTAKYVGHPDAGELTKIRERFADDTDLPFLPDFLHDNRQHYHLRAGQETAGGLSCWVVEWPGMDIFWVAPQRGFAIPRRIYCWGPGKARRFEFVNEDYREVKPGLWLPFRQAENHYASIVERPAIWGKVCSHSEYRLRAVEFDNVPDSLFDVRLPAGTRVADMARHFNYAVTRNDNSDPFTAELAGARAELKPRWRALVLWVLNGIMLVVVIGVVAYRMGKKKA